MTATAVTNAAGMVYSLSWINCCEGILGVPLSSEAEYDAAVKEARELGLAKVRDLHAMNRFYPTFSHDHTNTD